MKQYQLDLQIHFNPTGSVPSVAGNWLVRTPFLTLPSNLDDEENDGQYALFIGAGKSYTSFGCTGMRAY
jgi:hypothetical protein